VPLITDIKRQKRVGSTRFNIHVDGSYAFTMSDLDVSMSGLRIGQDLTQEEVDQYSKSANVAKAYALALRYLGVRLRSRREILDYLKRKDCEAGDIEAALERLEGLELVDDLKFAHAWIADRMAVRPRSRMRLSQELAAKGVTRDVVDTALQELEPDTEVATLRALIERKKRSSGYKDEKKLLGYLQRQGYRWSLIQEAMQGIEEEVD
jgi:regulatory protein